MQDTYAFDFSGRTVLVAEDNAISFRLISALLSRVNASVLHADTGERAIEIAREHAEVDLVLMDIQMPGMNGLDATRKIRAIRPGLPVIATTANTYDEDEAACREAGCSAYLTKPLKFRMLFELMDGLFRSEDD